MKTISNKAIRFPIIFTRLNIRYVGCTFAKTKFILGKHTKTEIDNCLLTDCIWFSNNFPIAKGNNNLHFVKKNGTKYTYFLERNDYGIKAEKE